MKIARERLIKYVQSIREQEGRSIVFAMPFIEQRLRWLTEIDPTNQKKYVDWMVKISITHAETEKQSVLELIENLRVAFREIVPWFHNNSQKFGDINSYTLLQLADAKCKHNETRNDDRLGIRKLVLGKDYKIPVKTKKVMVFQLLNFVASRCIGGNNIGKKFRSHNSCLMVSQTWCTAAAEEHFKSYTTGTQRLFYIMDLKNDQKFAVHFHYFNCCEKWHNAVTFYDAADADIFSWGDHNARYTMGAKQFVKNLGLQKFVEKQCRQMAHKEKK